MMDKYSGLNVKSFKLQRYIPFVGISDADTIHTMHKCVCMCVSVMVYSKTKKKEKWLNELTVSPVQMLLTQTVSFKASATPLESSSRSLLSNMNF